jgi:hypothetical protein
MLALVGWLLACRLVPGSPYHILIIFGSDTGRGGHPCTGATVQGDLRPAKRRVRAKFENEIVVVYVLIEFLIMFMIRKRSSLNRNRSKSCTPGTTSINYTLKIIHARTAGAESAARTCYKNMLRGAAPYMHSCFALSIH